MKTSFSKDHSFEYIYKFDRDQCFLRMSVSRFLGQLLSDDKAHIKLNIITNVLKFGSLYKHEILSLLGNFKKADVEQTIQNLILSQHLKGATDLKAQMNAAIKTIDREKPLNKRQAKAESKEKSEDSVPLIINYDKFLFEEKRQIVLDFARIRLCKFINDGHLGDTDEYKMFEAVVQHCDVNVTCSKDKFMNATKFSYKEISVACEANGV